MRFSRILILAVLVGHSSLEPIFGACTPKDDSVAVGSFNVNWIGYYDNERDDDGLADLLKGCDVVVIQELVAPRFQQDWHASQLASSPRHELSEWGQSQVR